MNIITKTVMNIEAACNAGAVAKTITDDKPVLVGVLYGNAIDFVQRANPAGGAAFNGFGGAFRIDPKIPEAQGGASEITTSGNLFLPEHAAKEVRTILTAVLYPNPEKPDKKARGAVEFAAKLFVTRVGGSPAWGLEWFVAPRPIDPHAALMADYERSVQAAMQAAAPQDGATRAAVDDAAKATGKRK